MSLAWESGNDKQTLYLSSKPDITSSPVTMVNSHGKKCQYYHRVATSTFAEM